MAAQSVASPPKMKKHQACYYLNLLIQQEQRRIEYSRERAAKTSDIDYHSDSNDEVALSEEVIARRVQESEREIAEAELKIAALELAADALTN